MNFASGTGPLVSTVALQQGYSPTNPPPYPNQVYTTAHMCPGIPVNTSVGYSAVLSASQSSSPQDGTNLSVVIQAESGFTGSATVQLQGTMRRYSTTAGDWFNVGTSVVVSDTSPHSIILTEQSVWPAYRIKADGVSGSGVGIIDWAMNGVFVDLNVLGVQLYAQDTEGGAQGPEGT